MFREIFRFELRQQLRSPLLWLVMLGLGALGFATVASSDFRLGGASGNIFLNAPYVVIFTLGLFSTLALFLVPAFVATAALRDVSSGTAEIMFSTPVTRGAYLGGRFAAGWLVTIMVLLVVAMCVWLGSFMPWLDAERLGPTPWAAYAWGLGVYVLPNLFFLSALLFCLASVTRSMLWTYIGVIVFFVAQQFVVIVMSGAGIDNLAAISLLDAFGHGSFEVATRYWTASDRNTLVPALSGVILTNRVIWGGIGLVLLGAAFTLFKPQKEGLRLFQRRRTQAAAAVVEVATQAPVMLPKATLHTAPLARLRQLLKLVRFDMRFVLTGVPFLVMLFVGLTNVGLNFVAYDNWPIGFWPVTSWAADQVHRAYAWLLFLVLGFYGGELVWRERSGRIHEVVDALPTPDWLALVSKVVTLLVVTVVFLGAGVLVAMTYQLWHGYHHLQPLLYLQFLGLDLLRFMLFAVLAVVLQALASNKFAGYALLLVYIVGNIAVGQLYWNDHLFWYAGAPEAPYSDMNGFGSFWVGTLWFRVYWGLFAAALLIAAAVYWPRGSASGWRARGRIAAQRFSVPARAALAVCLLGFVATGWFIHHNTHGLHYYQSHDEAKQLAANYEKSYRKYMGMAQPRITDVKLDVAMYPDERRVEIDGRYKLENKHAQPISELLVQLPTFLTRDSRYELDFAPHSVALSDPKQGFALYKLDAPLAPGASMDFGFKFHLAYHGFANEPSEKRLLHNGTFLNMHRFVPQFCYEPGNELTDSNERRKHGLGPAHRLPKRDDAAAHDNNMRCDADWLHFEATLSTSADQIALAPGYLKKTWLEGNRRYFSYVQDTPIQNFYSFQSARYKVARDHWRDVALEVYYDPQHAYNIQLMLDTMKRSLDYYTRHFGPYQFRQLRILEFPKYAAGYAAQSYANTVPFSEEGGFIERVRKPSDLPSTLTTTAHEIAHQWWGHQATGADVQGETMLSESLAEYSSLLVTREMYGTNGMRRFLQIELDRYLSGRHKEEVEENPLALVENQPYIRYNKGALVFYALQDYIGEEKVDQALRNWLGKVRFQQPPYTDTRDLLAEIRAVAGPQYQNLITDLFDRITLYDDRMVSASAKKRADGKYAVTLNMHAAKFYADGKGKETKAVMDIPVEIGVFAESDDPSNPDAKPLYLAKRSVADGDSSIELIVEGEPDHAGIDPFNVLIDRVSDDNRATVSIP